MKSLQDLSILVTCFNKEKHLSLFISNMSKIIEFQPQIVIVDDGSTDGSYDVLSAYLGNFTNVVLVQNPKNLGSAASRNLTISLATRKYIFFWDVDDLINIDALEIMMIEMRTSNAVLNRGKFDSSPLNPDSATDQNTFVFANKIYENNAMILREMGYWRYLYLREFIQNYCIRFVPTFEEMNDRYFILDDVFWLIWIASIDETMICSKSEVAVYQYNVTNHSSLTWRKFQQQAMLFPKASLVFLRGLEGSAIRIDIAVQATLQKMFVHLGYLNLLLWLQAIPNTFRVFLFSRKYSKFSSLSFFSHVLFTFRKAVGNSVHYQLRSIVE